MRFLSPPHAFRNLERLVLAQAGFEVFLAKLLEGLDGPCLIFNRDSAVPAVDEVELDGTLVAYRFGDVLATRQDVLGNVR
jgi:hypothetical protein